MRDITLEDTFYSHFTTRAFSTGIPTTLGGTPVLSVYEDDSIVQITDGVSVTADLDGVGGLNLATIVATAANGYEAGKTYAIVITTGTVSSVSVVGEVIEQFTVGASAAAVDLANGTDGLGAIKTDTAATLADTGTDGVVLANDAITAAKIAADAIGASELATDAVTEIVDGVWDEAQSNHVGVGSMGEIATEIATLLTNVATVDTVVDGIQTDLDNATDGLGALKALIDTVDTVVDGIQTDLDNGTDGLGALASLITTVDTVVDGIQTDLSNGTDGLGAIKTETAAILLDTGTTIPATIATAQADLDTITGADGVTLLSGTQASIDAIEADTGTDGVVLATDAVSATTIAANAIGSSELAATAITEIRDSILPTQNAAFSNLQFLWVAASDHVTPVTGASTTSVTRSIDGGAFGSGTGTLAEIGNGIYQYDASQADMNGGVITFRFVATGGTPGAPDDAFVTIVTGGGV